MKTFQDRIAVITGGASGIGLGMAHAFAARGMHILLADLHEDALDAAVESVRSHGVNVAGQTCNVADRDSVQALAERAVAEFGAVHVLCNNAGIGLPSPVRNIKLSDWKWMIDVDLWGPIYGIEAFLPIIEAQEEGHVCSTSSMAGLIASGPLGAYNVAKHGVVALMASLERELRQAKSNVTASVLCPGPIKTNISFNSVRFRPGGKKPSTDGARSGDQAKGIQKILEEQGMDPREVGELVAHAIENDKFWILTHPRWAKGVQKQVEAMREDQTLTRG
ncbi:MAG: SDR family NAD(P)-dependent oxidoreductase [Pseudomonadota bacterium]